MNKPTSMLDAVSRRKINVERVLEFHQTFNHPIGDLKDASKAITNKELSFRVKMIFEELAELAEAADKKRTLAELCVDYLNSIIPNGNKIGLTHQEESVCQDGDNVNLVEVFDAGLDIGYFVDGLFVSAGLSGMVEAGQELVHNNNMTKAHRGEGHAMDTIIRLLEGDVNGAEEALDSGQYIITPKENRFLLTRKDGKLIKPHDHVKVALNTLF